MDEYFLGYNDAIADVEKIAGISRGFRHQKLLRKMLKKRLRPFSIIETAKKMPKPRPFLPVKYTGRLGLWR